MDVCCVVTRYFGGILLGSGGLVRAYSKAASMALEAAGRARMAEWSLVETVCGYAQYERVKRLLGDLGAADLDSSFGADVSVSALLPADTAQLFCDRLTDVTAAAPGGAYPAAFSGRRKFFRKNRGFLRRAQYKDSVSENRCEGGQAHELPKREQRTG